LSLHTLEFEQELSALQAVGSHPNVVACVHHEKSDLARQGTIFLEYLPEETLFTFIQSSGASQEAFSLSIFSRLLDAVTHVHSKHLCHNDLKPENVMFNPATMVVKLFDFGLSERVRPEQPISHNCAGSPLYMAPEVYKPECHNPLVSDVWSLGIILYELLTGETPFSHCETLQELKDVLSAENTIPIPASISQEVRDLLSKLLSFDPTLRPTALELRTIVDNLRNSRAVVGDDHVVRFPEGGASKQADDAPKIDLPMTPRSRERILSNSLRRHSEDRVRPNEADDDDFGESEDSDGPCSSSA